MLIMNDCAVDPGDILFVVSHSTNPLIRLKRLVQAPTFARSKHGHNEVISVFVCTGKNDYGIICHNHERQLSLPIKRFTQSLQEKTIEELSVLLVSSCNKEGLSSDIKSNLEKKSGWMRELAKSMTGQESQEALLHLLIEATQDNKEKLIQLLAVFWYSSGRAEVLPVVHSSLLVFKPTDSKVRAQFLNAYLAQVEVTKRFNEQRKNRTNLWVLFKSIFQRSSQDAKDKKQTTPSEETFCSRNVIQVLNQIDSSLVNRGRHVIPKTLEAGMREATRNRTPNPSDANDIDEDDFEDLIAAQEKLLAPFTLQILPAAGTELITQLLKTIDKEINRIENKIWSNRADKQKAKDLKQLISPYRDPKFKNYLVNLQVNVALEILAKIQPTIQRKTGIFGTWIKSTSYANIRAFARTQGIFDGDVRDAANKLVNKVSSATVIELIEQSVDTPTLSPNQAEHAPPKQTYIFADWSFSHWSAEKRERMLEHMCGLIESGHALYTWELGQLIPITDTQSLRCAINGEDFDDLLSGKLRPATNTEILKQATQQKLDMDQLLILDYSTCQKIQHDPESFETQIKKVAPLIASSQNEHHLKQMYLSIIDVERENALDNVLKQAELHALKEQLLAQTPTEKPYQSGIDTRARVAQPTYKKPIFQPVGLMLRTPSSKYYRTEVYSDLLIKENPSSPFEYFELKGMHATEHLLDCEYKFHPNGLKKDIIKQRKIASKRALFTGEVTLRLSEFWQAIPSLHPNETLLDLSIKGLNANEFEIKYSEKNHLYYIRLIKPSEPKKFALHFLLQMPKEYSAHPIFNTLLPDSKHEEIHSLLMKYLKFGKDRGELRGSINTTVHQGQEYLDKARELSVGSCRLRAIAFKEEMGRMHPEVPVAVVVNSDHCFIEMYLDGLWKKYCLSGYRDVPNLMETVKDRTVDCMSVTNNSRNRFFVPQLVEQSEPPTQHIPRL